MCNYIQYTSQTIYHTVNYVLILVCCVTAVASDRLTWLTAHWYCTLWSILFTYLLTYFKYLLMPRFA